MTRLSISYFVYSANGLTNRLLGWLIFSLFFVVIPLVVSCSSAPDFEEPPEIRYGEDSCDRCLMIINEARFAAAYVTTDGQTRRFDDIGGMMAYTKELSEDVAVFWVHDFETEEWLKADEAYYVKSDYLTPMGFGVVAFAGQDRAAIWAAEMDGVVVAFAELLANGGSDDHDHTAAHNQE